MKTFKPAVAAFGCACCWRLLGVEPAAFPALAEDMDGALEAGLSEPIGMFITLAPELNIRAALAPTSHMPPPIASNALLCAGVIVFGCGTYKVPK